MRKNQLILRNYNELFVVFFANVIEVKRLENEEIVFCHKINRVISKTSKLEITQMIILALDMSVDLDLIRSILDNYLSLHN